MPHYLTIRVMIIRRKRKRNRQSKMNRYFILTFNFFLMFPWTINFWFNIILTMWSWCSFFHWHLLRWLIFSNETYNDKLVRYWLWFIWASIVILIDGDFSYSTNKTCGDEFISSLVVQHSNISSILHLPFRLVERNLHILFSLKGDFYSIMN